MVFSAVRKSVPATFVVINNGYREESIVVQYATPLTRIMAVFVESFANFFVCMVFAITISIACVLRRTDAVIGALLSLWLSVPLLFVIQLYCLFKSAQTLGMRMLGIQIASAESKQPMPGTCLTKTLLCPVCVRLCGDN